MTDISKADRFLAMLEHEGEIGYEDAVQRLKTRNLSGLVSHLRSRGHHIEAVMARGSQGCRYADAYRYHPRKPEHVSSVLQRVVSEVLKG